MTAPNATILIDENGYTPTNDYENRHQPTASDAFNKVLCRRWICVRFRPDGSTLPDQWRIAERDRRGDLIEGVVE